MTIPIFVKPVVFWIKLEVTNEMVRQLAYEIQRISEREINEREKSELRLQNALLRFERLLPPMKSSKKRK